MVHRLVRGSVSGSVLVRFHSDQRGRRIVQIA